VAGLNPSSLLARLKNLDRRSLLLYVVWRLAISFSGKACVVISISGVAENHWSLSETTGRLSTSPFALGLSAQAILAERVVFEPPHAPLYVLCFQL
jgi:hypothetical protein